MARPQKNPLFTRKLAQIEEESRELDNQVKMLSKNIRKLEMGELPPAAPAPKPPPRLTRSAPASAPYRPQEAIERTLASVTSIAEPEATPALEATSPAPPPEGELFSGFPSEPAEKKRPVDDAEKFAAYFASGSFGKSRPITHERRLQRNKAIFMLIFALLAAYIVYRMVF